MANVRRGDFRTPGLGGRRRAPRPRERPGAVVLSCNGRPGTRQGSRPPHRGAVLPVDAYSLAVACGSRGVSLDIWPASHSAPAAPRAVRLSGHDRDRSPSRTTRRATTWFPPRRSARQARSVRASAAPLAVVVRLHPRATANVAYGAFAMRRPPMLLRCSEALGQHSRCCHHTPGSSSRQRRLWRQ